jgi:hypothetical protein
MQIIANGRTPMTIDSTFIAKANGFGSALTIAGLFPAQMKTPVECCDGSFACFTP